MVVGQEMKTFGAMKRMRNECDDAMHGALIAAMVMCSAETIGL